MEIYVERYSALEAGWRGVTSAFVVGNVPDYRLCTGEDDRSRKSAENNTYIVEYTIYASANRRGASYLLAWECCGEPRS